MRQLANKENNMSAIGLKPLEQNDREQFIKDNQEAFNYGALEEFGQRDDHFEEEGNIISRDTIEHAIDEGIAYRIMQEGIAVGGAVIKTEYDHGELELLFVSPSFHSKGIGYRAWNEIEKNYPEITVWETVTPYFEKRNIHFYVNCCGFHIVEFFSERQCTKDDERFEMFRFEKLLPTTPEAIQQQVKRITHYEEIMQLAGNGSPELVRQLSDYYGSAAWKRDFAADEAGLLPASLKRGVLSEDGIYDLLEEFEQH